MAAVSDRQPDVSQAGGERGAARVAAPSARYLSAAALLVAAATGLALALSAGVAGVSAVPPILRTAVVAIALFAVCGYAAAQRLVSGGLAPYRALLVLPLGAAISGLALAVLGLLHVPLKASLAIVIVAGAAAAVLELRGARAHREPRHLRYVAVPMLLAGVVALISLIPIFRSGFATVPGQNGDAILVVGSAVLLEHAPPTATRTDLPINHIPLQWRSKYPIYYPLAAVATIAGQDPIQAFATVSALVLALATFGFFVFARYALRAPPWLAWTAMFLLALDRIVVYVTIHPYYNELWGQFALPFILLAGWSFLTEPSRRSAGLLAVFAVLGLLAYPLMLPFPLFFLVAGGWRALRRSELRWPTGPRKGSGGRWVWIPALIVAVPVALVLVRGFFEKTLSALTVLAPWTSLRGWHGTALPYLPWPRFVGFPGSGVLDYVGLAVVCVLAALALARMHSDIRWPLGTMVVAAALIGVYFRVRTDGELFFFKDLAFLGPYVLMLALVELGRLAMGVSRRTPRAGTGAGKRVTGLAGAAGLVAALIIVPIGAAREIDATYDNATPSILALRSWDERLPRGASLRIDVPPSGIQLWTTYMFKDHPLSALLPLRGFFPHPPIGRKADYVIAERSQRRPADALGAPLFVNRQFELWRMNPSVPGPDVSSRHLLDIKKITIG